MKSVLLVGLGRFGRHMAQKLHEMHHEVLGVDRDEQKLDDALPYLTGGKIGDATVPQFVDELGCATLICAWWPSGTTSKVRWRPPTC